jgi:lipopolysaccharide transport system permease protein
VTAYVTEIWRLRHFWLALVRVDMRRCYRHSILGLGWSLLLPLSMTVVLCTVFANLFNVEVRTFAPYLLAGLTVWNFVTSAMTQGCQSFLQGESYIRQHPAPLAIYPLRTTLGAGIHLLAGLVVLIALSWCLNGFGNMVALVSLVPTLALFFVLAWSLATCMGVLNVLFQDVQHLVQVLLQVVFYVTPIMYPANILRERGLNWVLVFNPLSAYLQLIRSPLIDAEFPPLSAYGAALATAAFAAAGACLLLNRFERRMIFYL